MDTDEDLELLTLLQLWLSLLLLYVELDVYVSRRRVRRWWVRPVNYRREETGHYHNLFREVINGDHEQFFQFTRMTVDNFNRLLDLVRPFLLKRSIRTPLPTELRLAFTLTYLAHGDSMQTQAWAFRVGKSTSYRIVYETCDAIWKALQPLYLPKPSKELWEKIAKGFQEKWNFPHCIGAVDGKHIAIQAPPKSGSLYWNYKTFFSIVLMACCDAEYRFSWVNVGDYGHISDGGIWNACDLGQALEEGTADLPPARPLPGTENSVTDIPYVLVGDEAFPLKSYMMRPYPRIQLADEERIFNYRLSRARRVIENTFGILVSRWRVLRGAMCCDVQNADRIVKALVCLHNFVMASEETAPAANRQYCPERMLDREQEDGQIIDGEWRQLNQLRDVGRQGSNNPTRSAMQQRNALKEYFRSDIGQVPWQWQLAFRGERINLPR